MIPDFELDKVRLFNCDCMAFMAEIPDNHYDLAIVDPPYGIGRFKICKPNNNSDTKDVFANKFLKNDSFNNNKPTKEYWNELFRISKNQIIWGANNFPQCSHLYCLPINTSIDFLFRPNPFP